MPVYERLSRGKALNCWYLMKLFHFPQGSAHHFQICGAHPRQWVDHSNELEHFCETLYVVLMIEFIFEVFDEKAKTTIAKVKFYLCYEKCWIKVQIMCLMGCMPHRLNHILLKLKTRRKEQVICITAEKGIFEVYIFEGMGGSGTFSIEESWQRVHVNMNQM